MDRIDRTFLDALFTPDYYRGYKAMEQYVAKVVVGILRDMRIFPYVHADFRSVDDVAARFNLHPRSRTFLHWMLEFMTQMGYMQRRDSRYVMKDAAVTNDRHAELQQIAESMPTADIFIRLVSKIEMNIHSFFLGSKSGGDILFSSESAVNLWNDYFNNTFYGYSTLNYGTAYGITKWFSQTEGKSMLEVGSGTSGATIKVFQMLRDNNLLGSLNRITLTDIIPSLLELGKDNIRHHVQVPPPYEQHFLDINNPYREQGLPADFFDIIYGVNVFHTARDVRFSLQEVYDRLNDNGIFVIGETIRFDDHHAMHQEVIFNLLENYYQVKLDRELRPYHGFLTKDRWISCFEQAGFRNLEYLIEPFREYQSESDMQSLTSFFILKGQRY
jgi:SAM-dependent methyltransferase